MKNTLSIPFFFLVSIAFAQQEKTFDLATYKIPFGWKEVSRTSNVAGYAITNNVKGTYAQVAIYASTNSKGSLQADFESEWQELVVKVYNPTENPELVPSPGVNGWEAKGGTAPFQFNGAPSVAMLLTLTGYGRCMSIVMLTNTKDYRSDMDRFLASVKLDKPASQTAEVSATDATRDLSANNVSQTGGLSPAHGAGSFQFSTTNFDDGWVSREQLDWVEVSKGDITVLLHYANKRADEYDPDAVARLKESWDILVAPRYTSGSNFDFKVSRGWETLEFGEADLKDRTGKNVHVVLFRKRGSGGAGQYMEIITANKSVFEREFGTFDLYASNWEKLEKLAGYNKFAVAASDLRGTWKRNFSGAQQYVSVNNGGTLGMSTHASNETFVFGDGNSYKWELAVASGFVGDIRYQGAKSSGTFTVPTPWQISFSDIEGKPRTYDAWFVCVRGARLLWLGDTLYGREEN